MNIKAVIIPILFIVHISDVTCFIHFIQFTPRLLGNSPKSLIGLKMVLSQNRTDTNHSNVYKMDFTEETEEEWLFKPRYAFGLNEFQITMLRIYVYTYAIVNIIALMLKK